MEFSVETNQDRDSVGMDRLRSGFLSRAAIYATVILGAGAALASAAEAKIVPGRSIDRVALGSTGARVQGVLGKPLVSRRFGKETVLSYGKPFLGSLSLIHHQVQGMTTLSKTQRTNQGIGPGSSFAATTAAYPQATCSVGPSGPNSASCVLDSEFNGRATVTNFEFFDTALGVRQVDIDFK